MTNEQIRNAITSAAYRGIDVINLLCSGHEFDDNGEPIATKLSEDIGQMLDEKGEAKVTICVKVEKYGECALKSQAKVSWNLPRSAKSEFVLVDDPNQMLLPLGSVESVTADEEEQEDRQ